MGARARTGTTMIGWFPAYDPEYAKYSPDLIQHLHMAETPAKIGVTSLDPGISNGSDVPSQQLSDGSAISFL